MKLEKVQIQNQLKNQLNLYMKRDENSKKMRQQVQITAALKHRTKKENKTNLRKILPNKVESYKFIRYW